MSHYILTANGNTAEFYGLTTAEAEQIVHSVAEQIDRRPPLLAGVGRGISDAVALRDNLTQWGLLPQD